MIKPSTILRLLLPVFFFVHPALGQMKTENFEFVHEGRKLSGLLDLPVGKEPTSIVVLIQGYGKSNVVAGNKYYDLRLHFSKLGIASCIWDKPGCGKSEGVFDIDQSVQSSANEAVAAIEALKRRNLAASNKIGLWGISRAGWICPLVIQQLPTIAYWISVSGTDDKENFGYLLETNLRIEGRSEAQTQLLISAWHRGNDIFRKGGSFSAYNNAIEHLKKDSFYILVNGTGPETEEAYTRSQEKFIKENHAFDEKTGLMIYIPDFQKVLGAIQCPVLAIFGEKDANINWRQTAALYSKTIGKNPKSPLTIKTFPDGNHNLRKCKTGGYRETMENNKQAPPLCDGYLDGISAWLKRIGMAIK